MGGVRGVERERLNVWVGGFLYHHCAVNVESFSVHFQVLDDIETHRNREEGAGEVVDEGP